MDMLLLFFCPGQVFYLSLLLEAYTEQGQRDASFSLLCLGGLIGLILVILSIYKILGIQGGGSWRSG